MNLPYIKEDKPYPEPMDWFAPTDVQSKLLAIRTIGEFKFDDKLLKREWSYILIWAFSKTSLILSMILKIDMVPSKSFSKILNSLSYSVYNPSG